MLIRSRLLRVNRPWSFGRKDWVSHVKALPAYALCGLVLILALLASWPHAAHAQVTPTTVSVQFNAGFIGTTAQNTNKADNILTFATLGIQGARFWQASTTGQFTAGQSNNIPGILELRTHTQTFSIPGSIIWRITDGGRTEVFGFTPDAGNPVQVLTYSGGTLRLDSTRNYGLLRWNSTYPLINGTSQAGNAATSRLVGILNDYLTEASPNFPPIITGPSGGPGASASFISLPENQTFVFTMQAANTPTWSITGGVDAARFTIDAATGRLSFVTAPDFEAPTDSDTDNVYLVQVRATSPTGAFSLQLVTVTVINVPEPVITASKSVAVIAEPRHRVDCATSSPIASAQAAIPGSCLEYTITVASSPNGSAAATDVSIVDRLPPEVLFQSVFQNLGFSSVSSAGGVLTATIGSLAAGSSASIKIRVVLR